MADGLILEFGGLGLDAYETVNVFASAHDRDL
jgi:hypothetical protein